MPSDPFETPDLVVRETGSLILEQQVHLQLIRTAEVLSLGLSDLLGQKGISGKQYNILRALRRGGDGGLTISQISEQMTDPRADVSRLMDRLEREHWVERRHNDKDRRVVRVYLTDRGTALVAELDQPIVDLHRSQLGHLSPEELTALIALLVKVRSANKSS